MLVVGSTGTGSRIALYDGMVFHNEASMMTVGTIGHAAFAAWMRGTLSKKFDMVLHEPMPPALLAILNGRTEANVVPKPVQDKRGRPRP